MATFYLYPVSCSSGLTIRTARASTGGFLFFDGHGPRVLTLLPAIRRGPDYVSNNGSPWRWPWYPWILFGVLGFGVCARAYYLCYTFHGVVSPVRFSGCTFSSLFCSSRISFCLKWDLFTSERVFGLALLLPVGLVALADDGFSAECGRYWVPDAVSRHVAMSPLFLVMLAVTAFYFVALLRRVPDAWLASP